MAALKLDIAWRFWSAYFKQQIILVRKKINLNIASRLECSFQALQDFASNLTKVLCGKSKSNIQINSLSGENETLVLLEYSVYF
jgi:hypothetical protein